MIKSSLSDEIEISLDSYLLNTVIPILLKNSRSFTLTNALLPPDFPLKINTATFQALIPEMYKQYPDKDLKITLDLDAFPMLYCNETTKTLQGQINLAVTFAIQGNETTADLNIFSMSTGNMIELGIDGDKEDTSIRLQIKGITILDNFVLSSNFGEVSADDIKVSLNKFLSSVIYFINNYLRINPIKIPVIDGLKFESININIGGGEFINIRIKPDFEKTEFNWLKKNKIKN
jgi:hypothetical protein